MHVNQFLTAVQYRITEGSEFLWDCYGTEAWYLDCGMFSSIIDRHTGLIYELTVNDHEEGVNLRWIDPEFLEAYVNEAKSRGHEPWQAYDDVLYTQVKDGQEMIAIISARAS